MFVGGDYLVMMHNGNLSPLVSLFQECEADEQKRTNTMQRGSGYLLYRILDVLVEYVFAILSKIEQNVNNVEIRVFDIINVFSVCRTKAGQAEGPTETRGLPQRHRLLIHTRRT